MRGFFAILIALLTTLTAAKASVVFIPFSETDKKASDFPFVGSVTNINNGVSGSATVIGDGLFVLTARHVITHNGEEDGLVLDSSNFIFVLNNKTYFIEKVYGCGNSDLAILKLNEKALFSVEISTKDNLLYEEFYGVGFGRSMTIPDSDTLKWDLPFGVKRVYKNRIEGQWIETTRKDGITTVRDCWMFTIEDCFSLNQPGGSITGEGIHGPGDSGGGIFIIEDGKIKLSAVIIALTNKKPYIGVLAKIHINRTWINICTGVDLIKDPVINNPVKAQSSEPKLFQFRLSDSEPWAVQCDIAKKRRLKKSRR